MEIGTSSENFGWKMASTHLPCPSYFHGAVVCEMVVRCCPPKSPLNGRKVTVLHLDSDCKKRFSKLMPIRIILTAKLLCNHRTSVLRRKRYVCVKSTGKCICRVDNACDIFFVRRDLFKVDSCFIFRHRHKCLFIVIW